jgi:hypothetical protein
LCKSPEHCVRDPGDAFADPGWRDRRNDRAGRLSVPSELNAASPNCCVTARKDMGARAKRKTIPSAAAKTTAPLLEENRHDE